MIDRMEYEADLVRALETGAIPALTVHNPWAALLVLGLKRGENRGWSRSLAASAGWVLVHSSKKWAGGAVLQYLRPPEEDVAAIVELGDTTDEVLVAHGITDVADREYAKDTAKHLRLGIKVTLGGLLAIHDVAHYVFPDAFPEERYDLVAGGILGAIHVASFVGPDVAVRDPWHQEGQTFWKVDAAVTMPLVEGVTGALGLWKPKREHTDALLASRDRWRWTRCGAFLGVNHAG